MCDTEKHYYMHIPARWLELIFDNNDSDMIIREAWFTCNGCHNMLEKLREDERETDDQTDKSVP